jgi:hypothetical protein
MKRKLLVLTAVLGIAGISTWAPQAEAVAYCNSTYCVGKPATTKCGCPPHTGRPGQASTCGAWNGIAPTGCWYAP